MDEPERWLKIDGTAYIGPDLEELMPRIWPAWLARLIGFFRFRKQKKKPENFRPQKLYLPVW